MLTPSWRTSSFTLVRFQKKVTMWQRAGLVVQREVMVLNMTCMLELMCMAHTCQDSDRFYDLYISTMQSSQIEPNELELKIKWMSRIEWKLKLSMTQLCLHWLDKCLESRDRARKIKWLTVGSILLKLSHTGPAYQETKQNKVCSMLRLLQFKWLG